MGVRESVGRMVRGAPAEDAKRRSGFDFLLEFAPGVDPLESGSARSRGSRDSEAEAARAADSAGKHRMARKVLERLRKNGLDVRQVRASGRDVRAFALRGRFETLLRQAEKLKLRKALKVSSGAKCSALFTTARVADFANVDDPLGFFSSGERLLLLEELVVTDPVVQSACGIVVIGPTSASSASANRKGDDDGEAASRRRPIKVVATLLPLHDQLEAAELSRQWIRSLGRQPLDKIAGYFGHARGFYFAFLGAYTAWLVPAALAGMAVFKVQMDQDRFNNLPTLAYLLFMAIWATSFRTLPLPRLSAPSCIQ